MGTSILSTRQLLLWDVLRSLKRRRKQLQQQRQQKQLTEVELTDNSPRHLTTSDPVVSPSDRKLEQEFSAVIDWLLEQWSRVPQLVEDFTFEQARQLANEALHLLLDTIAQKPHREVSVEWKLSARFTILLFFKPHPPSIDTLVLDTIDKQVFDLTGKFIL